MVRLTRHMRNRPGAFALALSALLVIAGGFAVDGWMLTIPSHVRAACTASPDNVTYITAEGTYCMGRNPAFQPWFGALVAILGVGLLVAAWRFDRRPYERPRQGWTALRAWAAPLLWLALLQFAAVPLKFLIAGLEVREPTCTIYGFIGAIAECPVSALVPSVLIPGLLNVVPVRWLWTADPRTRIAAVAASSLGF